MIWMWLSLIISWLCLNNSISDKKNQSHSASPEKAMNKSMIKSWYECDYVWLFRDYVWLIQVLMKIIKITLLALEEAMIISMIKSWYGCD